MFQICMILINTLLKDPSNEVLQDPQFNKKKTTAKKFESSIWQKNCL